MILNSCAGPADEIENYCWSVLANEDAGPNRYIVNHGAYTLLARQYDLHFFRVMAELHDLLATLHRRRVDIAAEWLKANGHLVTSAKPHLTPHSPEWFTALQQWDPAKAMMTREVVELAGRTDVCSICGDDPASDYLLEEEYRPAGGPDTLRLCDDCLEIRRWSGEPFTRLEGGETENRGS
jgi:hypothetical protein